MARISIHRPHALTPKKARAMAQKVADQLAEEYDLESEWDGDTLYFSRPGVTGELILSKAAVDIEIELGFLFSAFRSRIETEVRSNLDQLFGAA